jgi:hypothetical protein
MCDTKLEAPTNSSVSVLGQGSGEQAHRRVGRLKRPSKAGIFIWSNLEKWSASRSTFKIGKRADVKKNAPSVMAGHFFQSINRQEAMGERLEGKPSCLVPLV